MLLLKSILFALVCGLTCASVYDEALDKSSEEFIASFSSAFEALPLPPAAEDEDSKAIDGIEKDAKSELLKCLREALAETIGKVKENLDVDREIASELVNEAREISDRLRDLVAKDVDEKTKDLKERSLQMIRELIEKITKNREKRDLGQETVFTELELVNILEKVKSKIHEKVDLDTLSEYLRQVYGEASGTAEKLIKILKARGTDDLIKIIDAILGQSEVISTSQLRKKRALSEIYNRVADFLRGLGTHLLGRYAEFAEWLTTVWSKGISHAKNRHEQLLAIVKEVIQDGNGMHKEVIREAIELLRPYRKEIGNYLWSKLLEVAAKALVG